MSEQSDQMRGGRRLRAFDLALSSVVASANFAVSLYMGPTLSLLVPHVFVGALLMVPLNLCLSYFVWVTLGKRIFTLYFFVYGALAMPTAVWGSTPGFFKPLMGLLIGISLDLLATRLDPGSRASKWLMAFIFPSFWWTWTGGIWMIAGLPIVPLFQAMLGSVPALRPIVEQGFAATFVAIGALTVPSSIAATHFAASASERIKKAISLPAS